MFRTVQPFYEKYKLLSTLNMLLQNICEFLSHYTNYIAEDSCLQDEFYRNYYMPIYHLLFENFFQDLFPNALISSCVKGRNFWPGFRIIAIPIIFLS
jgi:hypothetical protein